LIFGSSAENTQRHMATLLRAASRMRGSRRLAPMFRHRLFELQSANNGGARSTTILCVRKNGKVAVVGDGQVSLGPTIVKPNAMKLRRIGEAGDSESNIIAGYAGGTADALTLLDRLERMLEQYPGQLQRSCVELAKLWRTDKYLRRLDAMMLVADKDVSLTVTGGGDVIEPHDGIIAIGSGGPYALAAARALTRSTDLEPEAIARQSMQVASEICVYTNDNFVVELIPSANAEQNGNADLPVSKDG